MTDSRNTTDEEKGRSGKSVYKLLLVYGLIWIISVAVFWFMDKGDAAGYSLVFIMGVLPISIFAVSVLIGKSQEWDRRKRIIPFILGLTYMLAEYCTFSMANNLSFHKMNVPEFSMMFTGTLISIVGIAVGLYIGGRKSGLKERQ